MKYFSKIILSLPLVFSSFLGAQDAKSAEAFVDEAVTFAKTNGKEAFFKEVNTGKFSFKATKTLYISVYDLNGKLLAHGAKQEKVGTNEINSKDAKGKFYVKERIDIAVAKGHGWVDYMEINPATNAVEAKTSHAEKCGDMIISCGVYKK